MISEDISQAWDGDVSKFRDELTGNDYANEESG